MNIIDLKIYKKNHKPVSDESTCVADAIDHEFTVLESSYLYFRDSTLDLVGFVNELPTFTELDLFFRDDLIGINQSLLSPQARRLLIKYINKP